MSDKILSTFPKNKVLILARHGEKGCESGLKDVDQPLTHLGVSQCRQNGVLMMGNHIIPDFVLCSAVGRAVQSATHLCQQYDGFHDVPPPVLCGMNLYSAYTAEAMKMVLVAGIPEDALCPLVMGHNPGMGALAFELAQKSPLELRSFLDRGFPSATVCVFQFHGEGWYDLSADTCLLTHVYTGSYPLLDRSHIPRPK